MDFKPQISQLYCVNLINFVAAFIVGSNAFIAGSKAHQILHVTCCTFCLFRKLLGLTYPHTGNKQKWTETNLMRYPAFKFFPEKINENDEYNQNPQPSNKAYMLIKDLWSKEPSTTEVS